VPENEGEALLEPEVQLQVLNGDAPAFAPVFPSVRRPGSPLTERAVNFIVKEAVVRGGVNPAASIHCLRHAHPSHAIEWSPYHACLCDAGPRRPNNHQRLIYAHARLGESSGRYLKAKFEAVPEPTPGI
jgi:integrase